MNSLNWKGTLLLIVLIIILIGGAYGIHLYRSNVESEKFEVAKNTDTSVDASSTNQVIDVNTNREEKTIQSKSDFYTIDAKYPVEPWDTDGTIYKYVSNYIDNKKEEWKDGGAAYTDEMKIRKDFPDRPKMTYQANISYEKHVGSIATGTMQGDYITYVINIYEYTGGAHGDANIKTFTFNQKGQIDLRQIINLNEESQIAIGKIIIKKLPLLLGDMYDKSMAEEGLGLKYLKKDGTFDIDKCKKILSPDNSSTACEQLLSNTTLNYYISNDGITFIMGQYQVAPYAAGMPEILINWSELADYLVK